MLLGIFILVGLFPGLIAHDSPTADAYAPRLGISTAHLLGTTAYGQDMFAQVIWGTRNVLILAFVAGLATTGIAVLVGVGAAYLGGLWDGSLNLVTDVLLVIPLFPLLIIIAAYLHGGTTIVLILVITVTSWSYTARQLRSQALSLRNRDFLAAARVRGERRLYIIVVEIIPTMTSLLVACFLTNALYAVLFASSLQFIGLGDPNTRELGHDAVLGAEQRGAADRPADVGDRARRLHRRARGGVRPAQLRLRRDRQPGAAAGTEDPWQAYG